MKILVLNCGSSSLKFAVFQSHQLLLSGNVDSLGAEQAHFSAKIQGKKEEFEFTPATHLGALEKINEFLESQHMLDTPFSAVGHRVVHGAEKFSGSVPVNEDVMEALKECSQLAPLHNPANILGIEEASKLFPGIPQVAVFDTAFHQTIPQHAYLYGLPMELYRKQGIRRYGFHGTSHRYVSIKTAEMLGQKTEDLNIITAHLGNGSSATAILGGKSVDTTMGMTPLEGLVMGTRSGTIDPGLFSYLHNEKKMSIQEIDTLLNKKSGLLGLSELSNDMRTLRDAAEQGHEGAVLAIDVLCFSLARHIGALAISLPSLDALVFTGGIGENNPQIRKKTLEHLKILGFQVNDEANADPSAYGGVITLAGSTKAMVVPTDEELLIAMDSEQVVEKISKEEQ
jgi:acetate kinase